MLAHMFSTVSTLFVGIHLTYELTGQLAVERNVMHHYHLTMAKTVRK